MPLTTRPLTRDDFDQSMALIREAFGDLPPGATPPSADDFPRPGYHADRSTIASQGAVPTSA